MSYEVFVFDWDGTLVDSESHIVESIGHAARTLGLPPLTYAAMKDIIGLGMKEALLVLYPELTDEQIVTMRKHYADYFFDVKDDHLKLFDGVSETLSVLQRRGVGLAVATGKSRHGLDKALEMTGLKRFFDIERCADETKSKPHPLMLEQIAEHYNIAPNTMLMIGDTEYDLDMAARIGMDSIGVSYGVHDARRLLKHSPRQIIDNLSELLIINK
jgi:phosphoglycolate phosphatase